MNIQNKTFAVTGGGNGIGRELVLNLVAKGANVAALDISEAGLKETQELAKDKQAQVMTQVVDITDQAAVQALPQAIIKHFGQVDGIINNAGIIQPFVRVKELEDAAIDKVMNVNFYGTLYMVRAFLPHLLERPEAHIANISSMGGFLPVPGQSVYGASKAAVKLLTEGLYAELKGTSVGVSVIFPGAIGTNIAANSGVKIEGMEEKAAESASRTLPPDQAAELIVKAIEQNKFRALVGSDAKFLDLFYRFFPKRATDFITKQMQALLG